MRVNELRELVGTDKIFSVDFIKKDGSLRKMNCRLGVRKHLKGGELKFDTVEKNLLPVFDMEKQGYRIINVSTIREIRYNNKTFTLEE